MPLFCWEFQTIFQISPPRFPLVKSGELKGEGRQKPRFWKGNVSVSKISNQTIRAFFHWEMLPLGHFWTSCTCGLDKRGRAHRMISLFSYGLHCGNMWEPQAKNILNFTPPTYPTNTFLWSGTKEISGFALITLITLSGSWHPSSCYSSLLRPQPQLSPFCCGAQNPKSILGTEDLRTKIWPLLRVDSIYC